MGPESGERFAGRKHPVHLVGGLRLDRHWVMRAGKCFLGARVVPGNLGKSRRGLKTEPAELHKQSWGSGCCWPRPGDILLVHHVSCSLTRKEQRALVVPYLYFLTASLCRERQPLRPIGLAPSKTAVSRS